MRLLIITALLAGCGGDAPPSSYLEEYGGSAQVYAAIADETDCATLQETFDRAAENNEGAESGSDEARWTLGYMTAADERMAAIGCYD